ncbi:MAG: methyltransferase MtaB domain-containing protein [Candidatus Hodarchaeales archaeon]|jgi:methanol--5-hydroxybenzimidazolylcobamide Co-methyltransferase
MKKRFRKLAFEDPKDLVFGTTKQKLRYGFNLEVGNGKVIPEVKYFPKPEHLETPKKTVETYKDISNDILKRAANLGVMDIQLELELPAELTKDVELGAKVVHIQKEVMQNYYEKYGIRSALRATVADIRNVSKEGLREGTLDIMLNSFERVTESGADAVCIESFGGKEIIVDALTKGDISGVIFATGLLASTDVAFIWNKIIEVVKNKAIPTGDTACAHANSAMVLAGGFTSKMISHVFAAVVRAISAVRTLASYEAGGIGPGKDCAYENSIIKAITGYPMSLEGKSSACAHSSLIGNIPLTVADLWSNESIEYSKLYGGMGPAVSLEMLSYDTDLLNTAIQEGKQEQLRDLICKSNVFKDPQALILSPDSSVRIGKAIVNAESYYERSLNAALEAIDIINGNKEKLKLPKIELRYIDRMTRDLTNLPDNESIFIEKMTDKYSKVIKEFNPKNYDL